MKKFAVVALVVLGLVSAAFAGWQGLLAFLALCVLFASAGSLPAGQSLQAGNIASPNWFDTNVLIGVVPNLKKAQKFLLNMFFGMTTMSDSEFVSIDIDIGKRRMTPFVSPLVEGKLVEQRRMQTNTYKPAYLKDKRAPDLLKPIRRMIGEVIGGNMSGQERMMANLNFEMEDQIDMMDRRLEWMAAQALLTGTIRVEGDGFDPVVLDFGRDALLTVALTGTAKWTVAQVVAGTAVPTSDIEHWQRLILKKSGAGVTDIIMTTTPFKGFLADPLVKGSVFYPQLASFGNAINPGAQIMRGAVDKGRWGQYTIWVYNDWYVDQNNVERPMLPDGTVILVGADLLGSTAYGQIMDPSFSYASLPYAPKTWVKQDPAQRLLMMQSSPIVFPRRPNGSLAATVCDAVET